MKTRTWWHNLFNQQPRQTVSRSRSRKSTQPLEVEQLEDRWMPANFAIYVAGIGSTGDVAPGSVTALHPIGVNTFRADNLRSAVADIATQGGGLHGNITIVLYNAAYTVNHGEIVLGNSLTAGDTLTITNITGTALSVIDGKHANRIFSVAGNGEAVKLQYLQLQNGTAINETGSAYGGAIYMQPDAIVTLLNDRLTGNNATATGDFTDAFGGAIYNSGAETFGPKRTTKSPFAGTPTGGTVNLTIVNTTIDHNTATGGSTSDGNSAGGAEGGGLYSTGGGAVAITASTFSNNSAKGGFAGGEGGDGGNAYGGGASFNDTEDSSSLISVVNSTFATNSAVAGSGTGYGSFGGSAFGGGMYVNLAGESIQSIVNDTIAFNTVSAGVGVRQGNTPLSHQPIGNFGIAYGGGVALEQGACIVLNTIVALNLGGIGPVAASPFTVVKGVRHAPAGFSENDVATDLNGFADLGHNLIGVNPAGSGFFMPTDFLGSAASPVDPGFATLAPASNGGPTQTIAIVSTSKAVNHGDNSVVGGPGVYASLGLTPLFYDQRGPIFPRKVGPFVDIGAYELVAPGSKGRDLLADLILELFEATTNSNSNKPPPPTG